MKWSLVVAASSYLGYTSHNTFYSITNRAEFYSTDTENGFVDKDLAFGLSFTYELNSNGNLETYLTGDNLRLPVYNRTGRLVVFFFPFVNIINRKKYHV